ncbi:MAG: GNAT family N-acetyltransferase [Dehalococcoidales bacterium]|nr:MAG: GNAT family N-acetyltransferase [Dehalococcoidales bacterium]
MNDTINILVRPAVENDFEEALLLFEEGDKVHSEALPQVFRQVSGPARTEEYFTDLIRDKNSILFVAIYQEHLAGLITVNVREYPNVPIMIPRTYPYIGDIVVAEKYRRKGIGQMLMNRVQSWAKEKGIFQLELNVWAFNERAISFFEKSGYTTSRHQMWKRVDS